ncbi:hypothetical protein CIK05_06230 [Bdellovibrio sp. qaytius]|nr:hypothetical protein CIK05_06230 [Bdellovibrio sp. qaytius]
MNQNYRHAKLLDRYQVNGCPLIFHLGCRESRITINDQQKRAFAMVQALFSAKKIKKGSRIAVVGAGFAGLTVAAAAAIRECVVTIYDKAELPLSTQRGAIHRWIHPNIFDWPKVGWQRESTELPLLNWKAALANDVVQRIDVQWGLVCARYSVNKRFSTQVLKVESFSEKPRLHTKDTDEEFDLILLAVGFGREQDGSYWNTDDTHQLNLTTDKKGTYLISGFGDSGLIDTLRACYLNFSHEKLHKLFSSPEMADLQKQLTDIDDRINNKTLSEHLLELEYSQIAVPLKIKNAIISETKSNVTVKLNGRSATPFNTRSMILNRFLVHLLIRYDLVQYIAGEIKSTIVQDSGLIKVVFNDNRSIEVDELIMRRGPKSIVQDIIQSGASLENPIGQDTGTSFGISGDFYRLDWKDRDALIIPKSDAEDPVKIDRYLNERFKMHSHVLHMDNEFMSELKKVVYELKLNNLETAKGKADFCLVQESDAVIRIVSSGVKFNQLDMAKAAGPTSFHGLSCVYDFMKNYKRVKFKYLKRGNLNIYVIDFSRMKTFDKCRIHKTEMTDEDSFSSGIQKYIMPSEPCDVYLYDVPRSEKTSKSRIFIFDVLKDQVFSSNPNATLLLRFVKGDPEKKRLSRIADVDPRVKIAPDK